MMKIRPATKKEFLRANPLLLDSAGRHYINNTDYYTEKDGIVTYHYNPHFSHPLTLNELVRWVQSVPLEDRDCEVWTFQGLDANGDANFFAPSLERAWEDEAGEVQQFEVKEPEGEHKIVYVL